jgi:hypothetical protein
VDYDVNSSFIDCFTFSNLTHFDIRATSSTVIFKTASCISSSKVSGYNESDCTDSEVIKCLFAALETSSVRILNLKDNKFYNDGEDSEVNAYVISDALKTARITSLAIQDSNFNGMDLVNILLACKASFVKTLDICWSLKVSAGSRQLLKPDWLELVC